MSRLSASPTLRFIKSNVEDIQFVARPPDWSTVDLSSLSFGSEANSYFVKKLGAAATYLEFGSGASTLRAASLCTTFITVDSDPRFLAFIQNRAKQVRSSTCRSEMSFLHADIGRTGPWGRPFPEFIKRPKKWRNYSAAPWIAYGEGFRADLILIDGRFRVACALYVALAQGTYPWTLLVDDYVNRPEYAPLEKHMSLTDFHGRMAEFTPNPRMSISRATDTFEAHISDWR